MDQPSPGLFGRDREIADAEVAIAATLGGVPKAVLVGGDAGIGKTTFVAAVLARAVDAGFTPLVGHCLDVDAGEPLAPVREALHSGLAGRQPDTLPPVSRRLEPYLSGTTPAPPGGLAEDLRHVVGELAREGPVLLVLEDMHWADASTRDFALALSRTMLGAVLLVLTYRSDDLVRRHPFRTTLVDIGRVVGAHRIDLAPLDRQGISGIVQRATGASDPSAVGAVLARSEGNPLYAEELLGADLSGVPVGLNDLLLARVDRLPPDARAMVRLASVHGSHVDSALLAAVSDLDDLEIDDCLRQAVDANVLRCKDDAIQFRHGLLREAVYDDLLPGERGRAHGRIATALDDRGLTTVGALTRVAFHWDAAHDQPKAFAAQLRAGLALSAQGHPEALTHLERALEMWDHVQDADLRQGRTKADVLCHMARAAKGMDGNEDRAMRFIREAIDQLDPTADKLLASRVYAAYAELCHELADSLGHGEAVTMAVEFAEGEPSEELARALIAMATWHARRDELDACATLLDRAVEVAYATGLPHVIADALAEQSSVTFDRGLIRESWSQMDVAVVACESAGLMGRALEMRSLRAFSLLLVGRLDEGEALAIEVRGRAASLGLREAEIFAAEQLTELWTNQGRFDDAELLLEEMRPGMRIHRWRDQRIWLLLARGDLAAAETLERDQLAVWAEAVAELDGFTLQRVVRLFCGLGHVSESLDLVASFLAAPKDAGSILANGFASRGVVTAVATARRAGNPVPPDLESSCLAFVADTAEGMLSGELAVTWPASDLRYARAVTAELTGEPSTSLWQEAYASARPFGAALALDFGLGLAAALLGDDRRDEARVQLVDTWQTARDLGARLVENEAALLARRSRIALPADGHRHDALAVLTPREHEVLEVLATGATNRLIAERLFISEKTVSVHVTNILAKLAVPNRGAAAALAREVAAAVI